MPQVLAAFFVAIGIPTLVATVAATVIFAVATSYLSGLLTGGGSSKSDRTERAIKSPTPSRNRSFGIRRLHGSWMLFDTAANGTTVDVWAFHDGRANAITQAYINDDPVTVTGGFVDGLADGTYGDGKVGAGWNLGLATETAFAAVVALMPGIWTTAHRGDGIVSAYLTKSPVKSKNFIEVYPQGDNATLSLAGEWRLCFDPREPGHDPDDPDTWAFTENAALHLLNFYMVDREYNYALKLEPVIGYWIDAADHCDEVMSLDAGGTEPRYRGAVAYDLTAVPGDVVSELLGCFDGWTALDAEGRQTVYSGQIYTPTVSVGPEQIVGYSHQSFVEDENHVNELIVQYISADHKYDTVEAQAWRDEADISATGRVNSDGFAPQVPSHTQARRLAKRAMLRRNAPNRGTVTTNFSGRSVIGQRFIYLTIEEAGAAFFSGVVEVMGVERDYDTGGVTFEWVEAVPEMDEWNPATEDGYGASEATRVGQVALDAPQITSAVFFGTDNTGTATPGARIRITATGPDRDDLTWFVRWRTEGAATWGGELEYTDVDPGASVTLETDFVPADSSVEVQVAYRIGDGRFSPWSIEVNVTTETITADTTAHTADATGITADRG